MLRKRKPKRDSGTRSRVTKGPARDAKHLEKVRASPCLACKGWGDTPNEAHHCRELAPRTMGKRVSDHLTTPLCKLHHAELHMGNGHYFWRMYGLDPAAWISRFSEAGRKAIEALSKAKE